MERPNAAAAVRKRAGARRGKPLPAGSACRELLEDERRTMGALAMQSLTAMLAAWTAGGAEEDDMSDRKRG